MEENKSQTVSQLQEFISDIVDEVASEMCDGFCHWPFVCASEDELDEHCDKCPLNKLF